MIGSLGYDPATLTTTDVLGMAGMVLAGGLILLAVCVVIILLIGRRP